MVGFGIIFVYTYFSTFQVFYTDIFQPNLVLLKAIFNPFVNGLSSGFYFSLNTFMRQPPVSCKAFQNWDPSYFTKCTK